MERAVLEQVAGYFERRLAGYPTTLSDDESLVMFLLWIHCSSRLLTRLFDQLVDGDLNPKKRVATQLVRLEKKILQSCLEVTIEFMYQLPDHSVSPCPAPYEPLLRWVRSSRIELRREILHPEVKRKSRLVWWILVLLSFFSFSIRGGGWWVHASYAHR